MILQEKEFIEVEKGVNTIDIPMTFWDYLMQGLVILQILIFIYLFYILVTVVVPYLKLRIRQMKKADD